MSTADIQKPPGVFTYRIDVSNSSSYGKIMLFKDGIQRSPRQLMEDDAFLYIIQKIKYYNGVVYDHDSFRDESPDWIFGVVNADETVTDTNWNGIELLNHAPTCHLLMPFWFKVENRPLEGFFEISITLDDTRSAGFHRSSDFDFVVSHRPLWRNANDSLQRPSGARFERLNPNNQQYQALNVEIGSLEYIRELAKIRHWDGPLDREVFGVLQILSNFINRNVYNGTRNIWIDDVKLDCVLHCCLKYVEIVRQKECGICINVITEDGCENNVQGLIYWDYHGDQTIVTEYEFGREEYNWEYGDTQSHRVRVEVWDACHIMFDEVDLEPCGDVIGEGACIAVRDIELTSGVNYTVGVPTNITGIVTPDNATFRHIIWSILTSNWQPLNWITRNRRGEYILSAESPGQYKILGTINNGRCNSVAFSKLFDITVFDKQFCDVVVGHEDVNGLDFVIADGWPKKLPFAVKSTEGSVWSVLFGNVTKNVDFAQLTANDYGTFGISFEPPLSEGSYDITVNQRNAPTDRLNYVSGVIHVPNNRLLRVYLTECECNHDGDCELPWHYCDNGECMSTTAKSTCIDTRCEPVIIQPHQDFPPILGTWPNEFRECPPGYERKSEIRGYITDPVTGNLIPNWVYWCEKKVDYHWVWDKAVRTSFCLPFDFGEKWTNIKELTDKFAECITVPEESITNIPLKMEDNSEFELPHKLELANMPSFYNIIWNINIKDLYGIRLVTKNQKQYLVIPRITIPVVIIPLRATIINGNCTHGNYHQHFNIEVNGNVET